MSITTTKPYAAFKVLSTFTLTALLFSLLILPNRGVSAHALISPPLGVSGTPSRGDVRRPSANAPCGAGVDVATALTVSENNNADVVHAGANGEFTVTAMSFDAGQDGSTFLTNALVDTTATGKSFNANNIKIDKNGIRAPTSQTSSVQVTASLSPNAKCTGGKDGKSCLVSFTTSAGFGNCVLVSQGGGNTTANANANNAKGKGGGAAGSGSVRIVGENKNSTGAASGAGDGNKNATTSAQHKQPGKNKQIDQSKQGKKNKQDKNKQDKKNKNKQNKVQQNDKQKNGATAAGSRIARSLKMRAELGEILERRRSWMWAI